jgi:hypothetical protein
VGLKEQMTKQEQFLWIVQATVIANAINLSSRPVWAERHKADISEMGVFIAMDEAVRASGLIPEILTAAQAANEFCTFTLKNMRDAEEEALGRPLSTPLWFAGH